MKKQSKYNVKKCIKMTKLFLRNTLTDLDILGIIDKLTRSAAQKQRVKMCIRDRSYCKSGMDMSEKEEVR